ncbi:Rv1733c family protein [Streptomyces sp. NPDC003393]
MRGNRHTGRRLWRWHSNPLRRHEDVVEAWIVLVMWVLILVGGAIVWTVTARAADEEFGWQRTDRHEVSAVLLTDAPRSTAPGTDTYRTQAKVRWTATDGTAHTARTLVPAGLRAGTPVIVWQDGRGALTTEPTGPTEARAEAVLFGAGAALAFSGLTFATGALARWWLDQRRYDQWGAEWDTVGPRWDQKTG